MAGENNDFKIIIGADIADAKSKLKDLSNSLSSLSKNTSVASGSIGSSMGKISSLFSGLGATLSVASFGLFIKSALQTSAQLEQTSIAFEVFTGSALVAKNMLSDLKDQALKSPMQFQDITKGAQTLLGYGLTAQQVIPITRMLGDISGGNADKFQRLSLAFGQVNAAGRLMGQEARQMINAGFNPLQAISDKTGQSMAVLTKRMHDGQISVKDVGDAFTYATSEGGRFFGMADRQSQTLQGQFNKLSESTTFAMAEIGASISENLQLGDIITHLAGIIDQLKNSFIGVNQEMNNSSEFSKVLKFALDALGITIDLTIKAWKAFTFVLDGLLKLGTPIVSFFDEVDSSIIKFAGIIGNQKFASDIKSLIGYFNDFGKTDVSPKNITDSISVIKKELTALEASKTQIHIAFSPNALKVVNDTIARKKEELKVLETSTGRSAGLIGLSDKPTGLTSKTKAEKVEIIPGLDFQTKEYGNHLKKLRQISADAISEINNVGLQGNKKKLADLQDAFIKEKAEFTRYGQDTTDITRLYLLKAAQISGEIEAERNRALLSIIKPLPTNSNIGEWVKNFASDVGKFNYYIDEFVVNDKASKIRDYTSALTSSLQDFGVNIFSGFANIAGSALAGITTFGDAISQVGSMFLSLIGDLLIQMGTSAIKLGISAESIKAVLSAIGLPGAGFAAIAAGTLAVAAGSLLKGMATKTDSAISVKSGGASASVKNGTVSQMASGSSYAYGGASYSNQSIRMMVDLTGSITATPTGYSINKSFETTLRVTGR